MNNYIEIIIISLVLTSEALIVKSYMEYLFSRKHSKPVEISAYLFGYVLLLLVYLLFNNLVVNAMAYFIVNAIILRAIYSCGAISAAFHSAILSALMGVSEVVSSLILSIYSKDYSAYTYRLSVLVALSILSKFIYVILCVLSSKIFTPHKVGTYDNHSMLSLCALPIASVCIATTVSYICVFIELPINLQIAVSICLVILLFANIYTLYIYSNTEKVNREILSMKLAMQKDEYEAEYYRMLEEQYDYQRILVHDVKNHMQAINGLAADGDVEEIQRYIAEWGYDKALQRQARYCHNAILNIIVAKTAKGCSENGISFHCDIRDKSVNFIDDTDISALFGNLLSNAYEAAKDSEEKLIEFDINIKPEQKTTTVKISNSCNEPPTKDERGMFISRKVDKEKHGLGQKSIKRIIEKYSGTSETYYDEVERRFEIVIVFSEQQ